MDHFKPFSRHGGEYEGDIPYTILVILPMICSKAAPSGDLQRFLKSWSLRIDPYLLKRYPQENWDQLYSSTYEACILAAKGDDAWMLVPPIPKPGAEIGTSSKPSGLDTTSRSGLKTAKGDDACILVPPIPKPGAEIGTSSKPSSLDTTSRSGLKMSRLKGLFRCFKS